MTTEALTQAVEPDEEMSCDDFFDQLDERLACFFQVDELP